MPFDAHQAKSLLTKNDFLAKLVCLFGLHKYILYYKPKGINEILNIENSKKWEWKKKAKEQATER